MVNKQEITVIIRCKNEEEHIGHSIQSVLDNIDKPQIVVVDNNSTDDSMLIVNSFKESPLLENDSQLYTDIDVVTIDNYTPGAALNLGIEHAKGKYVLVLSAHCVLDKIDLKQHKKDLKEHAVVYGNQIPVWRGKKIHKRYMWANFGDKKKVNYFTEFEDRYFLHNALAMYKTSTLKSNHFDPFLSSKEDRYWVNKIIEKGETSLYDPTMEAFHHYTTNGATWKGIG